MGYGIEIKNSSGNIIVDGTYKNFSLHASGTTESLTDQTIHTISFDSTSQYPLVAIKPSTTGYVSVFGYTKSGSNYTGFNIIRSRGVTNFTVDYKVFIAHPSSISENYGMIVYDDGGNIVFETSRQYFNIYQITTGISLSTPSSPGTGGTQDITHTAISDPYCVISPIGFWERWYAMPSVGPLYIFKTGIIKINSTTTRIGWNYIYQGVSNNNDEWGWNPNYNVMILK